MNIAELLINIALKGDADAVKRVEALQGSLDSAERSSGKLKKGLMDAFKSLPGAEFFTNPIVAITTGVGIVSKIGMEAEKTATSFNVLVGSEEKAAKMLGEINKYADKTLWDRKTVQTVSQAMLNYGADAEDVVADLKMLGDVAMGDKNKLLQLGLAFSQVRANTILQGNDYHQLINAGFNPLLEMSEMTGESFASLQEKMSKGLITFDMVKTAFQHATGEGGRFYNSVNEIAKTSFGAFEQVKGTILATLLDLYDVIQPLIIPVLNAFAKTLEFIGRIAKWVSKNIDSLIPVIKGLAVGIGAYIVVANLAKIATAGLTVVFKALLTIASINPFAFIVASIAAVTVALVACWNKFAGFRAVILTVWDTVKGFGIILKDYVLDRITGIVSGIGNLGLAISKLFKGDFAGAWETAKAGANQFLGIDAVRNANISSSNLIGGIRDNYSSRLDAERQKQAAKEAIKDPKAAAGTSGLSLPVTGGGLTGASASSTANAITTGGTRNTSIVLNIGKFFEDVVINNTNKKDFSEIRDAVLESINRSLEIAVSAAR